MQAEPLPIKQHFNNNNDDDDNNNDNNNNVNKQLAHTCWKRRKGENMRKCSGLKIGSCC